MSQTAYKTKFCKSGAHLRNVLVENHLRRENRDSPPGSLLILMGGTLRASGCEKTTCGEKLPRLRGEKVLQNSKVLI